MVEYVPAVLITGETLLLARRQGWLRRGASLLRKKHRVLVLGPSGVGKTQFLMSLTDLDCDAIDRRHRTGSEQRYRMSIKGTPFVFIDTPGQLIHKDERIDAIRRAIRENVEGILNVVCFGYHEGRSPEAQVLAPRGKLTAVREDYLEESRRRELECVREWSSLLGRGSRTPWVITVVTKADVWWDRREEVVSYYIGSTGEYMGALSEAGNLNRGVIEYCSVFHRFYGVVPMSGTFDQRDRAKQRDHLLREMLSAVGKRSVSNA